MDIENNKLIADFMNHPDLGTKGDFSYLKYHTSWDWLMPVVEKIENILLSTDNSFNVTIGCGIYCTIQDAYGELIDINTCEPTKIEATYKAVVEFIKWYNKNK